MQVMTYVAKTDLTTYTISSIWEPYTLGLLKSHACNLAGIIGLWLKDYTTLASFPGHVATWMGNKARTTCHKYI